MNEAKCTLWIEKIELKDVLKKIFLTLNFKIMKKLEKMSLANVEGQLTRREMSNIMAGSGSQAGVGGFFKDFVKTILIDQIYNRVVKPVGNAVINDWNSRSGQPTTQTERYAKMGPY